MCIYISVNYGYIRTPQKKINKTFNITTYSQKSD